jgi:prophage regulatory protein
VTTGEITTIKVLRLPEVLSRTGLSRSCIYDKMSLASPRYDSSFPKSFKLGASSVGWSETAINTWLQQRMSNAS